KKKKITRACVHCHKAHMPCDEERPCIRCKSKGLHDSCTDAPRKKKKYLMDVPDEASADSRTSLAHPVKTENTNIPSPQPSSYVHQPQNTTLFPQNPALFQQYNPFPYKQDMEDMFNVKPTNKFLSNAADMEYSTLSSIIQETGFPSDNSVLSPSMSVNTNSQHNTPSDYTDAFLITPANHPGYRSKGQSQNQMLQRSSSPYTIFSNEAKGDLSINQYFLGPDSLHSSEHTTTFPDVIALIDIIRQQDPQAFAHLLLSFSISIPPEQPQRPEQESHTHHAWGLRFMEQEDIYTKILKPFSYTPGYHGLLAYLKQRFARDALMRVAQSIAAYRPSFIACTNSLKEHDLIFMEQCFQRTLLEYDTFIKVSGTPTLVWRRTAQISYVGDEFCILTGWTKEKLLNKMTFIVELMDDKSVLEYFHLFSKIAFGDFRGATMMECTLLTPTGRKIRTACIWTLKRDVFGIPMMIVGNFLPIL
ncbi:hypothetical protein BABINDRAFT_24756, partial [Babjeviella inositovora NRRL Y-12698]